MPKLRRLSGKEVIRILERMGFRLNRINGSHFVMQRTLIIDVDGKLQTITQSIPVPVHQNQPVPNGTLRSIYRRVLEYTPADELDSFFYTE